jgi:DNA mismatch endonuclease (patch repair protein)
MSVQAVHDTAPEIALRSALHRRGLRYRTHVRPVVGLRREADIVFPGSKVAVFVDGCFWHGCPLHGTNPRRNSAFWADKIEMNRLRDADTDVALREHDWLPIRVWEHEHPEHAAELVEVQVRSRGRR